MDKNLFTVTWGTHVSLSARFLSFGLSFFVLFLLCLGAGVRHLFDLGVSTYEGRVVMLNPIHIL